MSLRLLLATVAACGSVVGLGFGCGPSQQSSDSSWADPLSAERQAFEAAYEGGWFAGCDAATGLVADRAEEPQITSPPACEFPPEPTHLPPEIPDDLEGAGYTLGFTDGCEAVRRDHSEVIRDCPIASLD